jgi:hypothetical protein
MYNKPACTQHKAAVVALLIDYTTEEQEKNAGYPAAASLLVLQIIQMRTIIRAIWY